MADQASLQAAIHEGVALHAHDPPGRRVSWRNASACGAWVRTCSSAWGYAVFNAMPADRQWFMRHANGHRTHHLHVVVHGGPAWQDRLRFRDVLRADPGVAARFAMLKQELARAHACDREAYAQAKEAFVRSVLEGA